MVKSCSHAHLHGRRTVAHGNVRGHTGPYRQGIAKEFPTWIATGPSHGTRPCTSRPCRTAITACRHTRKPGRERWRRWTGWRRRSVRAARGCWTGSSSAAVNRTRPARTGAGRSAVPAVRLAAVLPVIELDGGVADVETLAQHRAGRPSGGTGITALGQVQVQRGHEIGRAAGRERASAG